MTDIHAIIAAAKRRGGIADREPTFARSALYDHAINMAEAHQQSLEQGAESHGQSMEQAAEAAKSKSKGRE